MRDEGLAGQVDTTIFAAAQQDGRFFVTQDLDFADTRRYVPGTHQGLLIVRLRDGGALALRDRVRGVFTSEAIARLEHCTVVVTDRKARVLGAKAV